MNVYRVGGAVRDNLLGLPVKDNDWVVVGATVEEMLAAGYVQVGRDFPVFLHPETKEEYALARTERKSGRGYTGFVVHAAPDVTLEQDLERRDLTINALAQDEAGTLIDPFGGRRDLEQRVLRHVSPAFAEDPLRVLRVARFAARFAHLGFRVAPETLELMRAIGAAGELEHLVPERVWQEFQTALTATSPAVFIQVLRDANALAVILPELDRLFGVPQQAQHHPEIDTGVHALMALEQAAQLSTDPLVRFAALVHDVGKGLTPAEHWPAHPDHETRGAELIAQMSTRLRLPNDYSELARMASLQHTRCHRAARHDADELFTTLEACDALRRPERFELFLQACEADARGRLGLEAQPYPQANILRAALAAARSVDVKPLVDAKRTPPELGQAIKAARIAAIAQARSESTQ